MSAVVGCSVRVQLVQLLGAARCSVGAQGWLEGWNEAALEAKLL